MQNQPISEIIYTGLFVDNPAELLKQFPPKYSTVFGHHSTNRFKPTDTHGLEVGKKSEIKIIGWASDDKCDALLIENPKAEKRYPHITLSCAEGVPPVYANAMLEMAVKNGTIKMLETSVLVAVTEGYYSSDGKDVLA
jgi:hypothetical protein